MWYDCTPTWYARASSEALGYLVVRITQEYPDYEVYIGNDKLFITPSPTSKVKVSEEDHLDVSSFIEFLDPDKTAVDYQ